MFGILNINKPEGLTSFDVVARLRKILNIKQIGHAGTLDPMAKGVLPVCVGSAARLIEYFESGKTYRASMILGVTTDTYDLEGKEILRQEANLDRSKLLSVCEKYIGEIIQTPPMHSAVHYKGKRLYEYARQNIKIDDIPERKVMINSLEIKSVDENLPNPVVVFDVDCSGGTYIRSLINDIGNDLGCGAVMSELTRLRSGAFYIEESLSLEEVETRCKDSSLEFINPVDKINFEEYTLSEEEKNKIMHGQYLKRGLFNDGIFLKLVYNNSLAAIAKVYGEKIVPQKVFSDEN